MDLVNIVGLDEACKGISFESVPYNENAFLNNRMMFPLIFDDLEGADKQMYILCLKRVASELIPNVQQCYFFREEKREQVLINPDLPNHASHPGSQYKGWCGVYSNRPTMCRTYPIGLNPDSFQSMLTRREDHKIASQNSALKLCPKEDLTLADFGLDDKNALMNKNNDLLLNEARTKAHNQAVLKWNSQPKRSIKNVIKYFLNIGQNLIVTKQQIQKVPMVPQVINSAAKAIENRKETAKTE